MGETNEHVRRDAKPDGWMLAAMAVGLIAVVLRLRAFSPLDLMHPDEVLQYLEQGNRLVTGHGIRPWETREGMRSGLIPQLLTLPLWLGHTLAPGTLAPMLAARGFFMALTLLVLPAAWRLGALTSRPAALLALFVAAVWWESVLFSELLLSESLGTALLLLAAAPLLDDRAGPRDLALAGFLGALAVLVRLQFAPFAAVLGIVCWWRDRSRWASLGAGAVAALLLGAGSDLAYGLTPFSWIWANFAQNVVADRASDFGTHGPLEYLVQYGRHVGPLAPVIAIGALFADRRYRPLLAAAALLVLLHSAIPHKEYRFIWPASLTLLLLAAIASWRLAQRVGTQYKIRNATLLAAACLVWTILSLSSMRATGGMGAFRGGGEIARLAIAAARDPKTCRIAVAKDYRFYVVPSMLPRPVPLSIPPDGVYENTARLPQTLSRSANALLTQERPGGFPGWSKAECRTIPGETACLYTRPGTCTPDREYGYQRMTESYGL
jgi:GPI mannosyltransferase 3